MKFLRTKILVTLGPKTSSSAMIEKLLRAGANAVRLNFSHGTLKEHQEIFKRVRLVSKKLKRPVAILGDLPGPKLRTGNNEKGLPVYLKRGSTITLTTRSILTTSDVVSVMFQGLPKLLTKGDPVLLADGLLELKVKKVRGTDVECKVIAGGELGEHKGINLPGLKFYVPSLSKKDLEALRFLMKAKADYVALSFVQKVQDIEMARRFMKKSKIPIVAKIEKPEALDHIHSILDAADGIMIARGDLGVELPTARIPVIQKELIHLAALKAVPVITATQMLDSMVLNSRPTRAEATDVANAIWDGSDIVMLSNETASGLHPIEAVRTMANIISQAESHPDFQWKPPISNQSKNHSETILAAATQVAQPHDHKAVVTYTKSGATAIALSKLRPKVPIFALTPDEETYHRLSLIWGVQAYMSPIGTTVDAMIRSGDKVLLTHTDLKKGDRVIMVAGTLLTTGATNLMKIHQIGHSPTGRSRA